MNETANLNEGAKKKNNNRTYGKPVSVSPNARFHRTSEAQHNEKE